MKTLKLIIVGITITTLVYSCSTDRDDEVRLKAIEEVKSSNQKQKIKLNKSGTQSREGEPTVLNDTIKIKGFNSVMSDNPDTNINPVDGGDPTTITPPKR